MEDMLNELLQRTHPGALLWVAGGAGAAKLLVDLVKRNRPDLQGNVIQTITAGIAILVTLFQAWSAGVFDNGVDAVEVRSIAAVALLIFFAAVGVHSVSENQNRIIPGTPRESKVLEKLATVQATAKAAQEQASGAEVKAETAVAAATDAAQLAAKALGPNDLSNVQAVAALRDVVGVEG